MRGCLSRFTFTLTPRCEQRPFVQVGMCLTGRQCWLMNHRTGLAPPLSYVSASANRRKIVIFFLLCWKTRVGGCVRRQRMPWLLWHLLRCPCCARCLIIPMNWSGQGLCRRCRNLEMRNGLRPIFWLNNKFHLTGESFDSNVLPATINEIGGLAVIARISFQSSTVKYQPPAGSEE